MSRQKIIYYFCIFLSFSLILTNVSCEKKMENKIKIEFQYFEGCPNSDELYNNLKQAIVDYKNKIELKKIKIDTPELAKQYKFRGSPTILINGKDIEGMIEPLNPAVSCRYYPKGLPNAKFIKEKIENEIK